jgi:hypothetical protein
MLNRRDSEDERFGGEQIGCGFAPSGEAGDVAGTGDTKEEETATCGGGSEFNADCADDQQCVRARSLRGN